MRHRGQGVGRGPGEHSHSGIQPGKYLLDPQSHEVAYLVDPGIGGRVREIDGKPITKLDSPKATIMALVTDGILTQKLPWGLVLIGVFLTFAIELMGLQSLPIAVGVYLPISTSAPMFIGGAVRWLVERRLKSGARAPGRGGVGARRAVLQRPHRGWGPRRRGDRRNCGAAGARPKRRRFPRPITWPTSSVWRDWSGGFATSDLAAFCVFACAGSRALPRGPEIVPPARSRLARHQCPHHSCGAGAGCDPVLAGGLVRRQQHRGPRLGGSRSAGAVPRTDSGQRACCSGPRCTLPARYTAGAGDVSGRLVAGQPGPRNRGMGSGRVARSAGNGRHTC